MMKFILAFAIGLALFVPVAVAFGLLFWVLAHFVAWKPFAGLPWALVRVCVAAAALFAVNFAYKESVK